MSAPLVSVIMPVYNREAFVRRAIDSALGQTYKSIELITVDDGSTDGSREILESYASQLTILCQDNKGPYAARNLALSQAKGDFIAFLDSDDVWFPNKLERQLPLFDQPNIGAVFGDALIVDYDQKGKPSRRARTYHHLWPPSRGHVFKKLLRYDFIPQSSVVARRVCFETCGPFSLKGNRSSDYAKWVQLAMQYAMDYVEEPVFELAIHGSNWSRGSLDRYQSQQRLFEELLQKTADSEQQMELRHFLYDLRWHFALSGHKINKDLLDDLAPVPLPRRLAWLSQFLSQETMTAARILGQKLPRLIKGGL